MKTYSPIFGRIMLAVRLTSGISDVAWDEFQPTSALLV
jgi:hypothetical protein